MRLLLAAAPHRDTFGYSMPPPGLLRLGGELERAHVEILLEDLAYRLGTGEIPGDDRMADACADLLIARVRSTGTGGGSNALAVIGISVMGATLPIALAILERIRARESGIALWLGGPGTTGVDRALIERFPFVDAVVRGEGEVTTLELLRALDTRGSPRDVAGVTWRNEHGRVVREDDRDLIQDLSALAPCAWHLLPSIADYKRITGEDDGLVPIDSGRGCVYDCSFCTIGRFWSRRSRTLPARRLAEEVLALAAMPGAKAAYLCHDLFGANRGQAVAFCEELSHRNLRVPWEVRARADHLDRELLRLMGSAGCYRVLIGVESADAAVREHNQKGMRRDVDMLTVVDDCAAAGITPILSLILGLPGEDEAALEKSLDFCSEAALRAGVNISLHLVNPQPGCGLGEEFGERARAIEGIPPDMAFGTGETAPEREWVARHPDLFTTFALLPLPESNLRDLHAIASELPEVLMRYPRTFALMRERPNGESLGALALYRDWKASAKSFESFAHAARSPLVDDMLAWEQALVRAASRGASASQAYSRGPRARGERLELRHDAPAVARDLRMHVRTAREPKPTWIVVVADGPMSRASRGTSVSPMKGVTTLRVTRAVAEILSTLDGSRSQAELEAERPGIAAILERFAAHGLIESTTEPASIQQHDTVRA